MTRPRVTNVLAALAFLYCGYCAGLRDDPTDALVICTHSNPGAP